MPATTRPPPDPPVPAPAAAEPHPRWWRALHDLTLELGASIDASHVSAAALRHLPPLLDAAFVALRLPGRASADVWRDAAAVGAGTAEAAVDAVERGGEGDAADARARVRSASVLDAWGVLYRTLRQTEGAPGVLVAGWRGDGPPDAAARLEAVAQHLETALARAAAHAELHEAGARRDRFLSAMSHDLRTPITAIMGYGELLHDGIVGTLTPQQADMVQRITQVAGHLSHLVNDLLDLARLDAGRMAFLPEAGLAGPLVDDAVRSVARHAERKGLALRNTVPADGGPPLRADHARVRQILATLLSNAVRFTEAGAATVSAGVDGDRTWIEVSDTGRGLPDGTEEAVFDALLESAAGRRASREPGSGLGLAVSRGLARAMGGDLVARNHAGAGAAFTLYLPLPEEGSGASGEADAARAPVNYT
jgi:signal transduction histidine kinase